MKIELDLALKAIDDEEELTDEMPQEFWEQIIRIVKNEDKEAMVECLRIGIRLTKQSIRKRIIERISAGA
jgi:hypothetical protein